MGDVFKDIPYESYLKLRQEYYSGTLFTGNGNASGTNATGINATDTGQTSEYDKNYKKMLKKMYNVGE